MVILTGIATIEILNGKSTRDDYDESDVIEEENSVVDSSTQFAINGNNNQEREEHENQDHEEHEHEEHEQEKIQLMEVMVKKIIPVFIAYM